MYEIRRATEADAATIATQRMKMFQENGFEPVCSWGQLEQDTLAWTASKLREGSYAGWLAEENGAVVAGAGVWFMEFPPHWMQPEPVRGYLLNFYVAPEARGRGLAKKFVGLAVAECKRRGVRVAVLHASKMGQPIYEELGWAANNEMILRV